MTARDNRLGRRLKQLVLALALQQAAGASADVAFEPAVSVGISHTDNVALDETNPERATIYQLRPGFSLQQQGRRLTTSLDYGVEAYRYDELGESEAFQSYAGNLRAQLDPDNFWFDIGATRDQVIRDPDAPIPWDNLPISTNRADRDDYYLGPGFDYPFGNFSSAKGSLRRDRIRYDQDTALTGEPEFDTDTLEFSLDNYRKERGFSWAASYVADSTDFGILEPWEYRQAGIQLGGWVGPQFRLFAGFGKESAWDDPFDPSLEDDYWEAGFATSGATLMAEVAVGDRTFGSSGRASLQAVLPRWQTSISYSEQPTTVSRDLYRDLLITSLGSENLADFLTRPDAAERYISKLFRVGAGVQLSRTNVSLSAYDETREQRTFIDGTALEDEGQSGAELTASWRAGSRTDLTLGIRRAEITLDGVARDLRGWSIGAERQLGQRTSVSLSLGHNEESSGDSQTAQGYAADVVTVLLTRNFHR